MYEYGGFLSGLAAGYTIIGLILIILAVVFFAAYFVSIAAIFNKAGMPMWESIIPVYNMYVFFKIGKKESQFKWYVISWALNLLCYLILEIKGMLSIGEIFIYYDYSYSGDFDFVAMMCMVLLFVSGIGQTLFMIIMKYNLAKAFDHRGGFTVGLVLLEAVFYMILGFSSDEYIYGQTKPILDDSDRDKTKRPAGYIRCIGGERAGASIIMEEGETVKIGRDPKTATLIVDENNDKSKISRLHCEVEYDAHLSVYYVTDRSKNGVGLEDGTKLIAGVRTPVKRGTKLILPNNNVFLLA